MAYRLHRIDGITETPAWWNVGGTAFHECIREWETLNLGEPESGAPSADEQAERFAHHFAESIAATVLNSTTNMSSWRAARGGKEDRMWWLDTAPQWIADYVSAALRRESQIMLDPSTGQRAMEAEFLWHPAHQGLPPVKGFIDQVHVFDNGDVLIRDLKSGSRMPVDPLQLQIYRLAAEDCMGVRATRWWGDYWNARVGISTHALDLTDRTAVEDAVRARLAVMDAAERAGYYPVNPTNMCSACGVKRACPVMGDPATARPWVIPSSLDASLVNR